jgi:hypothetical protein
MRQVVASPRGVILELSKADVGSSGAKAASCGRLAALAQLSTKGKTGLYFLLQSNLLW